jgi:hypothetical protein
LVSSIHYSVLMILLKNTFTKAIKLYECQYIDIIIIGTTKHSLSQSFSKG